MIGSACGLEVNSEYDGKSGRECRAIALTSEGLTFVPLGRDLLITEQYRAGINADASHLLWRAPLPMRCKKEAESWASKFKKKYQSLSLPR